FVGGTVFPESYRDATLKEKPADVSSAYYARVANEVVKSLKNERVLLGAWEHERLRSLADQQAIELPALNASTTTSQSFDWCGLRFVYDQGKDSLNCTQLAEEWSLPEGGERGRKVLVFAIWKANQSA